MSFAVRFVKVGRYEVAGCYRAAIAVNRWNSKDAESFDGTPEKGAIDLATEWAHGKTAAIGGVVDEARASRTHA